MSEVAKLVGLEVRDYVDREGKARHYCGLHLCHLEGTVRDVQGCKVEAVSCPQGVEDRLLEVGKTYELVYEHFDSRNGKMARLADLREVDG